MKENSATDSRDAMVIEKGRSRLNRGMIASWGIASSAMGDAVELISAA